MDYVLVLIIYSSMIGGQSVPDDNYFKTRDRDVRVWERRKPDSRTWFEKFTKRPWSEIDQSPRRKPQRQVMPVQWSKYRWALPAPRKTVVQIHRMVGRQGTGGCSVLCPRRTGIFRHPNDCSKYYSCRNGHALISTCQYPLLFNEKERRCDWPELVACPNPPFNFRHICGRPFGLFPHPRRCDLFYNCWGGFPHLQVCPGNTYFSTDRQRCDWPHMSDCQARGNPVPLPPRNNPLPPGISFRCPSPSGQFPFPDDCTKYYLCTGSEPSLLSCPVGQLFEVWYRDGVMNGRCMDAFRVSRTCRSKPSVNVCGFVSGMRSTMATPNYPSNYDPNTDCNYIITRARDDVCQVQLTFQDFELETSGDCANDFLQVNDKQLCGMMVPKGHGLVLGFPRESSELRIKFRTNSFGQYRGFNIQVEQKTDCTAELPEPKTLPPPPNCDYNIPDIRGNISSLLYPRKYGDQLGCSFKFNRFNGDVCFLKLVFHHFQLEESPSCVSDYLEVSGKRYCGFWPAGYTEIVEFPKSSDQLIVQFVSNERINDQGFHLGFSQLECGIPTPKPDVFTCPRRDGRFAHQERCDLYFQCDNWRWDVRTCPRGTLVQIQSTGADVFCEGEDKVSCNGRSTVFPLSTTQSPSDFTCPSSSGQFPHETDCDKFYDCINYVWTIQVCHTGQLFKNVIDGGVQKGFCTRAVDVFCGGRTTAFPPPPTPETRGFRCAQSTGLFPHQTDCDKYYFCQQFQPSVLSCPAGQLFSIGGLGQDGQCRPANQVFCGVRTTSSPPSPSFSCPTANGQFEHPTDCDKYYECVDFVANIRACLQGQLFRVDVNSPQRLGSCDLSTFVNCGLRSTSAPPLTEDPLIFACPFPVGNFPHQKDCDKFYNCSNNAPVRSVCPPGQLFSVFRVGAFDSGACRPVTQVQCGSRTTALPPIPTRGLQVEFQCPSSDGVFRHPSDCNVYYRCVNNAAVQRFECPEGQIFSNLKEGELEEKCFTPSAIFTGFKSGANFHVNGHLHYILAAVFYYRHFTCTRF